MLFFHRLFHGSGPNARIPVGQKRPVMGIAVLCSDRVIVQVRAEVVCHLKSPVVHQPFPQGLIVGDAGNGFIAVGFALPDRGGCLEDRIQLLVELGRQGSA